MYCIDTEFYLRRFSRLGIGRTTVLTSPYECSRIFLVKRWRRFARSNGWPAWIVVTTRTFTRKKKFANRCWNTYQSSRDLWSSRTLYTLSFGHTLTRTSRWDDYLNSSVEIDSHLSLYSVFPILTVSSVVTNPLFVSKKFSKFRYPLNTFVVRFFRAPIFETINYQRESCDDGLIEI